MPYAEAIAKYGADKPDLRFGLEIQDFGPLFAESPFGIFREAVEHGGTVRGFVIPGAAKFSRREVDELVEQAKQFGAAGLVWARYTADGVQSSAKAIGEEGIRRVLEASGAGPDDLLVLASGAGDAIVEGARPAAAGGGEEAEPRFPRAAGSCSGSPTFRCSTGTRTSGAGIR